MESQAVVFPRVLSYRIREGENVGFGSSSLGRGVERLFEGNISARRIALGSSHPARRNKVEELISLDMG